MIEWAYYYYLLVTVLLPNSHLRINAVQYESEGYNARPAIIDKRNSLAK